MSTVMASLVDRTFLLQRGPRHQLCGAERTTAPHALHALQGPKVYYNRSKRLKERIVNTITTMSTTFDLSKARQQFPALQQDQVFLDNAGGSQALGTVIDSSVTPYRQGSTILMEC